MLELDQLTSCPSLLLLATISMLWMLLPLWMIGTPSLILPFPLSLHHRYYFIPILNLGQYLFFNFL